MTSELNGRYSARSPDWSLRQRQPKYRALAELAGDGHIAVHCAGEIATDGKAEPGSFPHRRQRAADLDERFEDRLKLVCFDPHPIVADFDDHPASIDRRTRQTHCAAGRSELDR